MNKIVGALCVFMAFALPFVIVPLLPAQMINSVAFSYGMQGPALVIGTPCIVLMIQGLRLWNGDL